MNIFEYHHLIRRAGFGTGLKPFKNKKTKRRTIIDNLFNNHTSSIPLTIEYPQYASPNIRTLSPEERRNYQRLNREKVMEYNLAWLNRMSTSQDFLRERMVYFWSTLFIVSARSIRFTESFNNTLRHHALGNFRELVNAVAKEASMLNYLDNNKNKKAAPNENFARELMELFTLGRDVLYTENDIKEAARAFTGWRFNAEGIFIEAKRQHDMGQKTFLGQSGNFNGDDIISIILQQKECAQYICSRIYRHFINENTNPQQIDEMVQVFYPDYNIEKLMRYIFLSDWFYSEENMVCKIKSPIELMVGISRLIPFEINKPNRLLAIQRILGQTLLQPPNVAGWPGGRSWIDSNTLMFRLRLPSLLFNGGVIDTVTAMEENEMVQQPPKSFIKAHVNRSQLNKQLSAIDKTTLHAITIGKQPDASALKAVDDDNMQNYLLKLMSLPEYQMC